MKLDNFYEGTPGKSTDPKQTILPFFGFEAGTRNHYYQRTIDVPDSYSKTGYSPVTRTESDEYIVFKRTEGASPEEDEFVRYCHKRIMDTPYIPTSLKEFYDSIPVVIGPNRFPMKIVLPILVAIGAIALIASLLSIGLISFESFGAGLVMIPLVTVYFSFWVGLGIDAIVDSIRTSIQKNSRPPFHTLSESAIEKIRQQYFALMVEKYGALAGDALRRYAIKKGYDRK